jgi:hypothetical protein
MQSPPLPRPLNTHRRLTLVQAGESDAKVIRRLQDNEAAFHALTPEAAAAQMPRLSAPLVGAAGARSSGAPPPGVLAGAPAPEAESPSCATSCRLLIRVQGPVV